MASIEDVIALLQAASEHSSSSNRKTRVVKASPAKKQSKPSAYSKKYATACKHIAPKPTKKSGGW